MIEIKRWVILFWIILAFVTGIVVNANFGKIGWNCTIDANRSIETCTRGVLM